jgi:hypothetical protein
MLNPVAPVLQVSVPAHAEELIVAFSVPQTPVLVELIIGAVGEAPFWMVKLLLTGDVPQLLIHVAV